jgi:hypothetical protein
LKSILPKSTQGDLPKEKRLKFEKVNEVTWKWASDRQTITPASHG